MKRTDYRISLNIKSLERFNEIGGEVAGHNKYIAVGILDVEQA